MKLMGKKMLPVLELDDGTMIGESLDILAYLGSLPGNSQLAGLGVPKEGFVGTSFTSENEELRDWEKRFKDYKSKLCRPRTVTMTHLTDWSDDRDVAYARQKYAKMGFDYEQALKDTPELVLTVNGLLAELDIIVSKIREKNGDELTMDEIALLPNLRTLTVVKDLLWPESLREYLVSRFAGCLKNGCELYFDFAC